MAIQRFDSVPGMSRAVIHNGVIYFTGHGARPEFTTPETQARAVLERLEGLLNQYGSDKEHVLSAFLFVKDIKDYLGITARVKLVEPKSLQRSEGKASRVIDKRQI